LVLGLFMILASGLGADDGVSTPQDPDGSDFDVLVILADDLGCHDVDFTGGTRGLAPEIDRLAAASTTFTNAYSDGPNCAPTRASLLTGLATPQHRVITVMSSRRGKAENRRLEPVPNQRILDKSVPTLPGMLRDAGWRTVHLGKFHVGEEPTEYGFTDAIGGTSRGHPKSYFSPYLNPALEDGPEGEYLTDRLAEEAVDILRDSDDSRRLFMYLSFYAVHTPLQARPDLLEKVKAAHPGQSAPVQKYMAMVMAMDEAVGRVLEAVEARDRPCLIVFASDNGGLARIADNGPYRGSKGMLYEGGIRVPLAVRWPTEDAPSSADHPVILRDLAPTILELAGIETTGSTMDGRSFAAIGSGGQVPARPLHWHFPAYLEGGGAAGPWRTTPVAAVRDGSWKMLEFFEDERVELYDLSSDPGEQINLARDNPEVVTRLESEMERWRTEVGARLPSRLQPAIEVQPDADDVKVVK
jgi:arylsulfatase A-like enzyme